jgi:hypothetical protein
MEAHERQTDVSALVEEIGGYLAAVELFRAEGCEPRWRVETPPPVPRRRRARTKERSRA